MSEPRLDKDGKPVAEPPQEPGDDGGSGTSEKPGIGITKDELIKVVQGVMDKSLSPLAERTARLESTITSVIERPSARVPGAVEGPEATGGQQMDPAIAKALKSVDFLDNPEQSAYTILGIASGMANQIVERRLAAQKAEEQFFEDNLDLKGNETVVQSIYARIATDKPHLQGGDLAKELADQSRREIARIKTTTSTVQTLPRVEPGGNLNPAAAQAPPKPMTQEEEVDDHIKLRRAARQKKVRA